MAENCIDCGNPLGATAAVCAGSVSLNRCADCYYEYKAKMREELSRLRKLRGLVCDRLGLPHDAGNNEIIAKLEKLKEKP